MWLEEWGGKIKKEFIRIKGLNMFCPGFIYGVDFYRANRAQKIGRHDEEYDRRIYPLKVLTVDWCVDDMVEVPEYRIELITEYGFDRPKSNTIPEIIDELIDQLVEKVHLDLDEFRFFCLEMSVGIYNDYLTEKDKENKRKATVKKLADACKKTDGTSAMDDVDFLYRLQKTKQDNKEYKNKEEELIATRLLANLLLQSTVSSYVYFGLLDELKRKNFAEESDIETVLEKMYGCEKSWPWYAQDYGVEMETNMIIDDVLSISLKKLLDTIGIDESYLHLKNGEE